MAKRLSPVHPGEILYEEFMKPMAISQNGLAQALRVPTPRIGEIVNRRRSITPGTALRLGRYFDTTPEFWMNLQTHYDLEVTRSHDEAKVRREVTPARHAALGT